MSDHAAQPRCRRDALRAALAAGLAGGLAVWTPPGLAQAGAAPAIVRCPQAQNEVDLSFISLLEQALARAPGGYALRQWQIKLEKGRALYEVARGELLDVAWAVTNRAREQGWLPVRIPLDRGMFGWRISLIRQRDRARFAAVERLADLAALRAGQGADWAETAILRANGLPVVTGTSSDALYAMLAARRFDYFPRTIRQAWVEAGQHADKGIAVEPHVVLHFPAAVYFFVKRGNTALAGALEQGLRAMLDDGSFERQFRDYYEPYLRRAELGRRRVIELRNPELTPETPLAEPRLWYAPG